MDVGCKGTRGVLVHRPGQWSERGGSGTGQWRPASKQEMCQTGRMNTNYHDRSARIQLQGQRDTESWRKERTRRER